MEYKPNVVYKRSFRSFGKRVDFEMRFPPLGYVHMIGPTPAGTLVFIPEGLEESFFGGVDAKAKIDA